MKLLIAADIFPPQAGGPATYAVALANEIVKRGDEVKIVSLNPDGQHISSLGKLGTGNITYHVSQRNKFLKYLQYIYLLWKHGKNTDVIYAMGPVNAGLPALIVAKLRRKKFVVKVVGDYAWEQFMNYESRIKNQEFVNVEEFKNKKCSWKFNLLGNIERFVAKNADKIIVPSEYLKKIVKGWGVEEGKIEVIYNAIEFSSVEPKNKPVGEKWIVSVGRLVPWKGFDTLIEIMPDLLKQFPSLKLKIVGDGPGMENIKYQISNIKLNNSVELVGALSHDKTLSYIKSADVFILNSGYEGLSHVILEALSFGRPVLASRIGGNPELLNECNLFAYNNKKEILEKIKKVLENENDYILDKQVLEKFKLESMIDRTKLILLGF